MKSPKNRFRSRPQLEALEERWVPTTVQLQGHVLHIQGNNRANVVSILQDDAANTVTVTYDRGGTTRTAVYSSNQVTRIEADLGARADRLNYDLGSNFTRRKDVRVQTGDGNDQVRMNMGQVLLGPDGQPLLGPNGPQYGMIQAPLDIDVHAGRHADRVFVDLGPVQSATVNVKADLGRDNDELFAGAWGDLSGTANVAFDAHGQDGDDVMRFAGRYDVIHREFNLEIGAQAVMTVDMDGGEGSDLVRASLISDLDGRLNVLLQGGRGDDRGPAADGVSQAGVSASVTLLGVSPGPFDDPNLPPPRPRDGSRGTLNALLFGNRGDDALGFHFSDQSGGAATVLAALVDGGRGADSLIVPVSPGVSVINVP